MRGDGSMTLLVKDEDASSEAGSGGLYKFLSHHVDIALTKGFDDSTSRTAAQPFEVRCCQVIRFIIIITIKCNKVVM